MGPWSYYTGFSNFFFKCGSPGSRRSGTFSPPLETTLERVPFGIPGLKRKISSNNVLSQSCSLQVALGWLSKWPWATRASDPDRRRPGLITLSVAARDAESGRAGDRAGPRAHEAPASPPPPRSRRRRTGERGPFPEPHPRERPPPEAGQPSLPTAQPLPALSRRTVPGPRLPGPGACVTRSPRRPRPLSQITGPAPRSAQGTNARPSSPVGAAAGGQ